MIARVPWVLALAPPAEAQAWHQALQQHPQWPEALDLHGTERADVHARQFDLPWMVLLWDPVSPWMPDWRAQADGWRQQWAQQAVGFTALPADALAEAVSSGVAAVAHAWRRAQQPQAAGPRWRWVCADCDDADCERHSWLQGTP